MPPGKEDESDGDLVSRSQDTYSHHYTPKTAAVQ